MLANASIQKTTTLQGLPLCAVFDGFLTYAAAQSCPHGWMPAFAGMTREVLFQPLLRGLTMIESIDHFVITVADVETTLAFYERVLGFTRSMIPRNPAALKFGSQKINVHRKDRPFEPKAKRPTPGAADFCLVAAGPLEEIKAHVEKCGVTIEVGPVQRMGARGEMTSIYFRDPDGDLVEVSKYSQGGAQR